MPRQKKQTLKKRKDGRYACRYKDQWFYSAISSDDALEQREEYKRLERQGVASCPVVDDYAWKWLKRAKPQAKFSTTYQNKLLLKKLLKHIGYLQFDEVKPSMIKDVYSSEFKGLSDSYIKHAKSLYCSMFDAAVDDGYISTNPARAKTAKPHQGKKGSHRAITPQERIWIETLCTDHRMHPVAMLLLYSGMRPQEVKAFHTKSIDFKKRELYVREFIHKDGANKYAIDKEGKTSKATRTVPLFSPLIPVLEKCKGYIITNASGAITTPSGWKEAWRNYRTRMEEEINGCKLRWNRHPDQNRIRFTVTPYDLRHSFVTWCRDNRVELHTVVEWVGHADAKMIMQIYDEFSEDRSKSEAERLEKIAFHSQNGSQEENKNPADC